MTESFDISPVFQRYRVSHHAVAMMFAAGLEPFEIERRTGFTRRRLTILYADPTFQELITYYAKRAQEKFVPIIEEVEHYKAHNTLAAVRQLKDRLELADEEESSRLPVRELIAIAADGQKTIQHKHSGSVDLNIAARLDRAIERSGKQKTIEHQPALEAQVVSQHDLPQNRTVERSKPAPRPSFASVLRRPRVA
jgi:hypothetical protein